MKEEYNLVSCSACGAYLSMHRFNYRRRIDSYSNLSQPECQNGIYKKFKHFFKNLFLKCCAGVEESLDGESILTLTDQEKEVEERSIDEVDKVEQIRMDTIQNDVGEEEEEYLIISVCDDDKKEINN